MLGGAVRKRLAKLECGYVISRVVLNCVKRSIVEFGEEIRLRRAGIEMLQCTLCRKKPKQAMASQTRDT